MDDQEKRQSQRIRHPFTLKFRAKGEEGWNGVTPVNMSDSGICLLTTEPYPVGSDMEVYISDPLGKESLVYECKVVRCEASKSRSMFYTTAVQIEKMSDYARLVYRKLLESFRERKKN